ncbi:MAG: hypothetical protein ACI8P9_004847 [Parasphingorhabdus sp.]|jgi:hypothetical protein
MASIFSRLFGTKSANSDSAQVSDDVVESLEYCELLIQAIPQETGGQWRLAGKIVKRTAEGEQERDFIRADLFSSKEQAGSFSVKKGQQIIDEQGKRLFSGPEKSGRV